ncbi:MAG: CoA-binding protein [Chloroflexales bacterium]|nr:CoA-binding protein [Chloroflexales bacterium]
MKNDMIAHILRTNKTIAVVGLSSKPERASYQVAAYLQRHGYRIIPVNPRETHVLGEQAYATLRDVPLAIDIVDVFRESSAVPEIVAETIAIGAKVLWLQLEIHHADAEAQATAAGITVVSDVCIKIAHAELIA